jgi:hypothetical protein
VQAAVVLLRMTGAIIIVFFACEVAATGVALIAFIFALFVSGGSVNG